MATRKTARKIVTRSEPAAGYTEDTDTFPGETVVYRCASCAFDSIYAERIVQHIAARHRTGVMPTSPGLERPSNGEDE